MIIVSQDRKQIINFNNVMEIAVKGYMGEEESGIWVYVNDGSGLLIGTYKTEKRAKEVLANISNTFSVNSINNSTYEYADLSMKMRHLAVYEMPEE